MEPVPHLYPPSVTGVPSDLTVPGKSYRNSVAAVFASLVVFLLFYLGLIVGAGMLTMWAWNMPLEEVDRGSMALKFGTVSISAMLFLFLVKGLFKRQNHDRDLHLEITAADHPELFAFVQQLCIETKAPFPHRVFLSPDVNAAVFYNSSVLNLLFPVKKNLLIGLGLVNTLDLAEFKAVLAHEFGHFAQSSMRLGTYVYISNRIIADMVAARDRWDEALATWRNLDLRIAIFGHLLYFIIWVLRGVLTGAFRAINFLEAGLSRQMEFHADLVAVSVTGSDSLVHALARLEFANECLSQAVADLKTAADHKLHTRDLYFHQSRNVEFLRAAAQAPRRGLPPDLPEDPTQQVQVFEPGEGDIPSMWASHPPNFDREQNAKKQYFRSVTDDRSPWELFRQPDQLREAMTRLLYKEAFEVPETVQLDAPEKVQAFIDEEHAETVYDPRYLGLYEARFVEPGELEALAAGAWTQPRTPAQLREVTARLYDGGIKEWLEGHTSRQGDSHALTQLLEGEWKLKGKTFTFRDADYTKNDVKRLSEMVEKELEADTEWLSRFDAEVFQAHLQMARDARTGREQELIDRYRFHIQVQAQFKEVAMHKARAEGLLEYLQKQGRSLEGDEFKQVLQVLREVRAGLGAVYTATETLAVPVLKNLEPGQSLRSILFDKPLPAELAENEKSLRGEWVGELMQALHTTMERVRRIHFKSLGGILALQEQVCAAWQTAHPTENPSQAGNPEPDA